MTAIDSTDFTHDPGRKSWVDSANDETTDFPIQNLPFGIFQTENSEPRIGIAIGDKILDAQSIANEQFVVDTATRIALGQTTLNALMSISKLKRIELRHVISNLLEQDTEVDRSQLHLVEQSTVKMSLPCSIGDYTDFYASVFHATNVGSMFRPDNPLLPNYKHIPIGYHGRSSSIGISGESVVRPVGQKAPAEGESNPSRSPSALLDYEFEVGFLVAEGNQQGTVIEVSEAEEFIFGMVLVNDWSARDLQKWEYQPLGPFLAKSFATTISPWVVTMEALAPFRRPEFARPDGDPKPIDYLSDRENSRAGGIDLTLVASLQSESMRNQKMAPHQLSKTSFTNMYWTIAQLLAHHSSNGCNMRPGDLLASGTVSGPKRSERGCLLELTWNGDANHPLPGSDRTPIQLPTGEERKFLADGDQVIFQGICESEGCKKIGFGICSGTILPATN